MTTLGKYQLRERIGQGGMGAVYRAHDPVIGRDVAIKIIREEVLDIPDIKTRFHREARSAGRLSHENITVIHDVDEQDGQPYIVMEYLPGTDLRQMLDSGVDLTVGDKLLIALQIAEALKYAHEHDVVHRDIKPENIRILPGRKVKILDFGIARLGNETLTLTRASIGTPKYMSPEQITGDPIDHRSDVFSFGVLLYELLSGINPFSGSNVSSISYKIVHQDPDPIPVGEGRFAGDLRSVVMTCLAKDREKRYQNFAEVIRDLKRSMKHGTIPTRTSKPDEKPAVRSARWIWTAAATIAVAGGIAWILLANGGDPSKGSGASVPTREMEQPTANTTTPNGDENRSEANSARDAMVEARRIADIESSEISSNGNYIEAQNLAQQGLAALASGTPEGLQEARRFFTEATSLFETSVESFHETRANQARSRANDERERILARTPGIQRDEAFRRADARRDDAESFILAGSFEEAADSYAEATRIYQSAERTHQADSDPVEDTRDQSRASDAQRRAATDARANAESLERSVSSARQSGEYTLLFREVDRHIGSAEEAMSAGRYRDAIALYQEAETVLQTIYSRVESARETVAFAVARADSARRIMDSTKQSVSAAQSDSDIYRRAVSVENEGVSAYSDARYDEAERYFSDAATLFEQASAVAETVETMSIEEEAITAMNAFADRTERFFSNEDSAGLESVSSFFSASEWKNFFDVAHDVVASVESSEPAMTGQRATFDVAIRLTFLNNRDNRMENTLRQRWVIEKIDGQWGTVNVESAN